MWDIGNKMGATATKFGCFYSIFYGAGSKFFSKNHIESDHKRFHYNP
jgi:methyl coenzyme M reductase beta subunit